MTEAEAGRVAAKDASDWQPILETELSRGFYPELLDGRE